MATGGTLILERNSERDIKFRDMYVLVDDMPEENVLFGQSLEVPLAPGEHRLRITNRLFHDEATFTVHEGETVRFTGINVLKPGVLNLVAMASGGVVYKPVLERN
ncbi:hypothetical protein EON82_08555 [bacterium]|nr:MAG: hypothetical protein EON82_08555 [bacterium]